MVTTHVCHGQKPASKYIFRPSYDMRYGANKTKQEPPGNHFMEERLQIVKSKTNKQTNKKDTAVLLINNKSRHATEP